MNPLPGIYPFSRNWNGQTNFKTATLPLRPHLGSTTGQDVGVYSASPSAWAASPGFFGRAAALVRGTGVNAALLALAATVVLAAGPAQAGNLLVNPSFEANSGNSIPIGWTYFMSPLSPIPSGGGTNHYWVESAVSSHSGTFHWKEWGALYAAPPTNNVAGIYQTFSSASGSTYQASGWFYTSSTANHGNDLLGPDCVIWIEVSFLGASSNVLALYKSDNFSASVGSDAWFPYSVTNVCDLSSPVSTGDPYFTTYAVTGSVSQLVAPPGTTKVRYQYAYLQAGSEGGAAFLDDAVLNQTSGSVPPVISSLFPVNMIFVNPADGITFNVSSPSGTTINTNGIQLVVNGVDVSRSLAISGSSSSKNVAYSGLQSNLTYTVSITVTDSFNFMASASTYFETTWVGIQPITYLWEAEDWDFNSGTYVNNPDLCSVSGNPNCYFGKVGVEGADEHNTSGSSGPFRPGDPMGTAPSEDYFRKNLFVAGRLDYCINPFQGGEWLNYTRDWPNGTYWVVGRLATGASGSWSLTLSKVNPDTSITDLGTFTISGGLGWSTFENIYLKDINGNNALVTLNGKQTLRVTSGGNLLPNFFMLVAAQADSPLLSNVYPTGAHPFEYTNALSFTVTAFGSSFPTNDIRLNLDGNDVSSNLVITGTASTKNVVYPFLLPNAIHVAIIAATNSLGHGILVTNRFDTFSEGNYMVEAEDFDYGGGQYIANWVPDAYADYNGPYPATTNIDFQHISLADEVFNYRAVGIPQDLLAKHDWVRSSFKDALASDYVLVFFAGTDWANYTREYPAGSFYAYIRSSGDGPFSMYLDQVVSGAGTVNQVTKRLGHFGGVGKDYITFAWVPLTDNGLAAPAVVKLNSVTTLRLTTDGNCNPNYFMLVSASGITLTARASAGNIVLSFPSQTGLAYRVFYRTNLTAGNWTLLSTVAGTGTVNSVSDPSTGTSRFYRVTAP